MSERRFTIEPVGPFDLSRSIGFLERWPVTRRPAEDKVLRFAFCAEHDWQPVGVRVTQEGERVDVQATGPGAGTEDLPEQVARILSLDIDGTQVEEPTRRDPVVAKLAEAAAGLRPVCFWTPWEAACWAVLTQRTSMRAAAGVKSRISEEVGEETKVDGRPMATFPSPETVLQRAELPGVNPVKLDRIKGLAKEALEGTLTARTLRGLTSADALDKLRGLPGIGPFSAGLILIRGAGAPDVFPTSEPRLLEAMRAAYGLTNNTTEEEYKTIAENWRPLRSWISFWLRSGTYPK